MTFTAHIYQFGKLMLPIYLQQFGPRWEFMEERGFTNGGDV